MERIIKQQCNVFANIVAGHTLLKILSGFLYPALTSGILLFFVTLLPMAIFVALVGLEIANYH